MPCSSAPAAGACMAMRRQSVRTSSSTGRSRSSLRRTERVVVSSVSAFMRVSSPGGIQGRHVCVAELVERLRRAPGEVVHGGGGHGQGAVGYLALFPQARDEM